MFNRCELHIGKLSVKPYLGTQNIKRCQMIQKLLAKWRKVKKFKLPSLRTFDDVEENLKLTNVYEINPYYDTGDEFVPSEEEE